MPAVCNKWRLATPPLRSLVSFLEGFSEFMAQLIANHPDELGPPFREAWFVQEQRIATVIQALSEDPDDTRFEPAGLTGEELELKVSVFEAARAAYNDDPSPPRAKDVLEASDITLGSLSLFFPVLHGVEEMKKIAEYLLDRGSDWVKRWLWPF